MTTWLALGAGNASGVLVELPGIPRIPVVSILAINILSLPNGANFGPFKAASGPFAAFGVFDAATDGAMACSAAMGSLSPVQGAYLSFPRGDYPVTLAATPGNVLTVAGIPVTASGQPLTVTP